MNSSELVLAGPPPPPKVTNPAARWLQLLVPSVPYWVPPTVAAALEHHFHCSDGYVPTSSTALEASNVCY